MFGYDAATPLVHIKFIINDANYIFVMFRLERYSNDVTHATI